MPPTSQRQNLHRRGMSFDQQQRSPIRRQQGSIVSITNAQQLGQQILREAQQNIARPGQQQLQTPQLPVSPQCGFFPGSQPQTPYDQMTMNSIMQSSPSMHFASSPYYGSPDIGPMQSPYQAMPMLDENNHHYFQQAHVMPHEGSQMMDMRRMSQPNLQIQTQLRPHTPQEQLQNGMIETHCGRCRANVVSTLPSHTTLHPDGSAHPILTLAASIAFHSFTTSCCHAARSIIARNY